MSLLAALIIDESKWFFTTMLVAALVVFLVLRSSPIRALIRRQRTLLAMNLFFGSVIAIMASGHLLAVSVKLAQGTLRGSPLFLYLLGLSLALPAWWFAARVGTYVRALDRYGKTIAAFNLYLGLALAGMGMVNLPLAAPAAFNLAYQFHRKRLVGRAIITLLVAGNVALFIGAAVFMASGQSFEQFSARPSPP